MIIKKWNLITVLTIIFLIGAMSAMPAANAQRVRLQLWVWWWPDVNEEVREQIEEFMEMNPDIKVQLVHIPKGDYYQKLMVAQAAGTMPDILWVDKDLVLKLAQRDSLFPLDCEEELEEFPNDVLNRFRYGGRLYGKPLGTSEPLSSVAYAISRDSRYTPEACLYLSCPCSPVVNDPAELGPYPVLSWEYSPDPEDPNDPLWTDVSPYFNSPDSRVTYTMDHVPLHGIIRYPSGLGPFPLVLIVHGNHNPIEASEPGYVYLCKLLASNGIIAVTIDENFLNGFVDGEMDARAIALLRHLQRWRNWNGTSGHTFYNKIDMNNIGLAGHSRGGEAIIVAWLFNNTLHNPTDPDHNFDFNLKSLFAIAPVHGQYYPTTAVEEVEYFIMHGSHDGDLHDFQGQKTYDLAHPVTSAPTASKSLLWVYGANHGQWNTIWGTGSDPYSVNPIADRISAADQQAIGKVYMSAYYQMTLQGKEEYRALFTGDLSFNSLPLGVTLVYQYQDKDRILLNHFEEDDTLSTGSYQGVTNDNPGNHINPYQDYTFSDRGSPYWLWQQTDGLIAGWTNTSAQYVINLPATISSLVDTYPYLGFRVGQVYESTPSFNTPGVDQDFSIQLELGSTDSYTLKISNFDSLPYPEETLIDSYNNTKTIMKTVRIPLHSFVDNHADWNLHNITKIQFKFDQETSGLLAIDEIQLTR